MTLRLSQRFLTVGSVAATLALAGCGGGDDEESAGETGGAQQNAAKKDVGPGPVTAAVFAQCIDTAGAQARPVDKDRESDSTAAVRRPGVDVEQVTVESEDFAHTAFVAVAATEADAQKAEPAAKDYSDDMTRNGNALVYYFGEADTVAALKPLIERCTP